MPSKHRERLPDPLHISVILDELLEELEAPDRGFFVAQKENQ